MKTSTKIWIGIIIILIIIAIIGFLVYKNKKQKINTSEDIITKKNQDFEQRLNPKPVESKEVRKGISRV